MARILLAWELGDGFGHVTRLLPIARRLTDAGHECIFAVRDVVMAWPLLADAGFWVLQAPFVAVPDHLPRTATGSFGDILAVAGFSDPSRLAPLVGAWSDFIAFVRPDLIIADFSPILSLSLYGIMAPALVVLGDGFTLPPLGKRPLPAFPGMSPRVAEAEILRAVAAVQRERRRRVPGFVAEIFPQDRSFVVCLPELDPYATDRGEQALGPLEPLAEAPAGPPSIDWYAYLSLAHPGTEQVIEGLAASKTTGSLYIRDASPAQRDAIRAKGLTVHEHLQELRTAVGMARVVIHHGGLGTSQVALALGRPQLLVPRQLEQRFNADALGKLGLAVGMGRRFTSKDMGLALSRALGDRELSRKARDRSSVIAGRGQPPGLDRLLAACQASLL